MTTQYPLAWPEGWPRTRLGTRKNGAFRHREKRISIADAIVRVRYEIERLGADPRDDCIVSTNLKLNLAGNPRGDQGEPGDPGAAVYWQQKNKPMRVMAIDAYTRVADNIAAIAATLEAMRAIERHGGAQILDRAFTGFTALPPPSSAIAARHWSDVLGVSRTASLDDLERAYRVKAREAHPDTGGSEDRMTALNVARDAARKEIGSR